MFQLNEPRLEKSNRKAMNRNWGNQKTNPALKTKTGNKNKLLTERAAISQKVATQLGGVTYYISEYGDVRAL